MSYMCNLLIGIVLLLRAYNNDVEISAEPYPPPPQVEFSSLKESIKLARGELPEELRDIIVPADYDKEKYYKSYTNPMVGLRVIVLDMTILEDVQKCNVSLVITVEWTDGRLRVRENSSSITTNYTAAPKSILDEFWVPRANVLYKPSGSVTANPEVPYRPNVNDTRVHWKRWESEECPSCVRFSAMNFDSNLLNILVEANINYKYFPNDKHICEFKVRAGLLDPDNDEDHDDTPDIIPLHYRRNIILEGDYKEDLVFDTRITSTAFTLAAEKESLEELDYQILFNRRMEHYIYQVYLPSGMFVIIGWLSMFLPLDIGADRVTLTATNLLTVTTFFNAAKQTGPVVSQLRAMEVWLLGSIFFVFLMLIQNIIVLRVSSRPKGPQFKCTGQALECITTKFNKIVRRDKVAAASDQAGDNSKIIEVSSSTSGPGPNGPSVMVVQEENNDDSSVLKSMRAAEMLDWVCQLLFLLALGISQGIYWNWLLNSAQQGCDVHNYCKDGLAVDTEEFWSSHQNSSSNYRFAPYCSNPHLLNCY